MAASFGLPIGRQECKDVPADIRMKITKQKSIKLLVLAAALMPRPVCAQAAVTFTSLYSFTGGDDGYSPNGLVQGSDGYFYGTTINGGTNSDGTVFKISTSGKLTSLYAFTGGSDGSGPQAALAEGNDGYFYGTTQSGGSPVFGTPGGTVFKISPNGGFTNLYSFTSTFNYGTNGASPQAALVLGTDGNFYGTTFEGGTYSFNNNGTNGYGTVFKISPDGALTNLYSFSGGNDGANPAAGLVRGSDGYFYGTTQAGGADNFGTVFKMSTNGALTGLYSFSGGNDGGGPLGRLVDGGDGYFYGTTASGGVNNFGTIFRVNTNGMLTTLYLFTGGADGENPQAGLVRGSDGNFYGPTQSGGTNGGGGTLFKITAQGALTTLYSFTGVNDGSNPEAELVQGSDGNFYGTTINGGQGGAGTIFRLSAPLGPPELRIIAAAENVILTWPASAIGFTLQSTTNLAARVWATNLPAPIVVNGQNTVTNPISGIQQFFRLSQ
jgi:uncharacterized repeat protein (TIGR03803 family)